MFYYYKICLILVKFQEHIVNSHTRAVGTQKYMAQEVLDGHYNSKCGIYSLGVIGKELFESEKYQGEPDFGIRIREILNVLDIMTTEEYNGRPSCSNVLEESDKWNIQVPWSEDIGKFLTHLKSEEMQEYSLSTYLRYHFKIFN